MWVGSESEAGGCVLRMLVVEELALQDSAALGAFWILQFLVRTQCVIM